MSPSLYLPSSPPIALSSSCLWNLVRLKVPDQSACSLWSPGLAVDKSSPLLSSQQNTNREEDTPSTLSRPGTCVINFTEGFCREAQGCGGLCMSISVWNTEPSSFNLATAFIVKNNLLFLCTFYRVYLTSIRSNCTCFSLWWEPNGHLSWRLMSGLLSSGQDPFLQVSELTSATTKQ